MPSLAFPIDEAQLTGIFLKSILFGGLLISYAFCLEALLFFRGRLKTPGKIRWPLVVVSSIFLGVAILDLCLGFYHLIQAFVLFTGEGGATAVFADISNWINVTRSALFVVQTTLGNMVLIYRCWLTWNRSWRVVAPSICLWLGTVAMTTWVIWIEATLHAKVFLNVKQLRPAGTSYWVLNTVLNITTTTLLVYKIWLVEKETKTTRIPRVGENHRRSILELVMRYIIESGIIYTSMELFAFIPFILQSTVFYPMTDVQIVLIGLASNLIIVRTSKIIAGSSSFCICASNGVGDAPGSVPRRSASGPRECTTRHRCDTSVEINVVQDSVGDFAMKKPGPL